MSTSLLPSLLLLLVGIVFGSMPWFGAFRELPRWIRVGLHTAGAAFVLRAALYSVLTFADSRISPQLHRLVFAHILILCGMGFGILLLLAVSGEYFKALRQLSRTHERDNTSV